MKTNGDPEGRIFYPTLTQIMDSFSCSPLFSFIYLFVYLFEDQLPEVPQYVKMQCHRMTLPDALGKIAWVR